MTIIVLAIVVALITLILFIQKVVMKKRLSRGLGRKASDRELTSLTSWMNADDKKSRS